MTKKIVECVANYSEARRPEVIEAIAAAISQVTDVHLLDQHSDLDHNRTVLTFAGPPEAVGEAAFRSIAKAAELIDLNQHRGEHPRIGATDVVPFVPVSGVDMAECVEIAQRTGQRVGDELGIPVYLYEEAATQPDRKNLENIRRGEYEGLKETIANDPNRLPDFGPPRLGPAGATVIGARYPLIAFNVYLTTGNVSIARRIAKAVRHSSGGLRYVKALGMLVEGQAQVSMNLTNFQATPIFRVVELIRREASRYGVGISHSELVGLIPEAALVDTAVWHLQLDQFEPRQILENRLGEALEGAPSAGAPDNIFLDALAADSATPGGGSAAAYTGAAAAALVAMVARLTIGRQKYAGVDEEMRLVLEQAETLRKALSEAVVRDAAAFEAVMAAFKLPKNTPEDRAERKKAIEAATYAAAEVPMEVVRAAVQVIRLASHVTARGNLNAISDAASAAALGRAALTGAGYNVRINIASLEETGAGNELLAELVMLEKQAAEIEAQVRFSLQERGGFSLA